MDDEPWWVTRRRELEAAAPVKRPKPKPYVKMPLEWTIAATRATCVPRALVLLELQRASWRARSLTFPLPNERLVKLGVSRKIKYQVLHDLERAGLAVVERPPRKTPIVTLLPR
jgi:hypothetical protein